MLQCSHYGKQQKSNNKAWISENENTFLEWIPRSKNIIMILYFVSSNVKHEGGKLIFLNSDNFSGKLFLLFFQRFKQLSAFKSHFDDFSFTFLKFKLLKVDII